MDSSNVCRTCLSKEALYPIFKTPNHHISYTNSVFLTAGVKIHQNDGFPQKMCSTCIEFINMSTKFRWQCKNAEMYLLQIENKGIDGKFGINNNNIKLNQMKVNNEFIEIDTDYTDTYLTDVEIHQNDDNIHQTEIDENNHIHDVNENEDKEGYEPKPSLIICQICSQKLSLRNFEKHMAKKHPNNNGQHLKCGLCNNEYESKDAFMQHVQKCSSKKKGRIRGSTHCGRTFGNKFRLNEHCRAKHGYEKFKCSDCDFQSASTVALKNHERRHRGEKPFVCEACGADFHAAYLLTQHRHSHRTDKLFKCDLCPASFKANNSLHVHRASCHGQALHRCTLCLRAYACRHYAVKHMRHVHRYSGPIPQLQTVPNGVQEIAEGIYDLQD